MCQGPCKVDSVIKAERLLSIMDRVTVAIATVQLDFPRSKSHQRSLQEKKTSLKELHMNGTLFHSPQIKSWFEYSISSTRSQQVAHSDTIP